MKLGHHLLVRHIQATVRGCKVQVCACQASVYDYHATVQGRSGVTLELQFRKPQTATVWGHYYRLTACTFVPYSSEA
jgi:hypothetical protein